MSETDKYAAQRGIEQKAMDLYHPTDTKIRAVSPGNTSRTIYEKAARDVKLPSFSEIRFRALLQRSLIPEAKLIESNGEEG